jgi:hypothetical protein
MTLTGDHMAWQQRVFKETNTSSKFLEQDKRSVHSEWAGCNNNSLYSPIIYLFYK